MGSVNGGCVWHFSDLDRFSPYYEQAASFDFTDVEPFPAYSYVYPLAPAVLANDDSRRQ